MDNKQKKITNKNNAFNDHIIIVFFYVSGSLLFIATFKIIFMGREKYLSIPSGFTYINNQHILGQCIADFVSDQELIYYIALYV